jgi:two-component system, LuxR family, sensor kinase FixL
VAPPLLRLLRWIVELIAVLKGASLFVGIAFAFDSSTPEKSVLVLCGERSDLPAIQAVEENLREVFHSSRSPRIELFSEYLDLARFSGDQQEKALVSYLQARYAGRRIDLVVPVAGSALEFALTRREELFPAVPMVFCAMDQRELEPLALPADVTGIIGHFDIERTIELILQLQPGVPEIVCVSGTSGFDRRWAGETRKVIEQLHSKPVVRWITDQSLSETIGEVGRVPKTSAVFFISMLRDGAGQSTSSVDVVRDLARVAKAPIYGLSSQFLDAGVVGGAMFDFGLNGRKTGELALKALRGQWVPFGAPETESQNPLLINWLALKKAGLSEEHLPPGVEVKLRPPGLWETHHLFILVVGGAILLQTVLIAGLILERFSRRKAEASLRQSEERMNLVADGVNLGMEMWDTARDEVWMTERGRALFGIDREARIDSATIVARVHPDDRALREALIGRAIQTHGGYSTEYRVVLPDGTIRWIGARGRSLNSGNGKATRVLGVSIDVTAQKYAEDRFRLVVEGSPNGIVLMNEQGRIELVNTQVEILFGYWREELIGKPIEILVPERFRDVHPIHRGKFVAAPTARTIGAGRELFGRRKDGSEFPVEIGISPIQGDKGILVLAAIVDISARKQAEAESRQYREELAHLNRVEIVAEMATALAHELNQPLSGIMNNASAGRRFIAKGRADMPKLDRLLDAIVMDVRRAGEIIRGIRAMVRKGEGARVSVNLNSIIGEVVQFVRSDALERHCMVLSELDPDLPAVSANPVQIQQVLLNIVINAFDAMRQTPVAERRVIIRSERQPNDEVCVSVRDYGTGLPKESPERIFEAFFSTKQDGLGMGLSIARSIISSHGGELTASNAEGGGTCIHFSLPAAEEDVE